MNILDEIVEYKKTEIAHRKKQLSLEELLPAIDKLSPTRDFKTSISKPNRVNLIAEIKRASPSAGIIVEDFNVEDIAKKYNQSGADAISVLTEIKYFHGDIFYIDIIKQAVPLPVLRKDFIIDEYQLYESRYFGADAVLLIAAILNEEKIKKFLTVANGLNLSVLVEVHTEDELKTVLQTPAEIIGINNRNLSDLTVDINTTLELKPKIPDGKIVVSESGIKNKNDIEKLRNCGVHSVLIGERILTAQDIPQMIKELFA